MRIAQVTRVSAAGVWVQMPAVLPAAELGPLDAVVGSYAAGDRVLVDDLPDDQLAVVGRLA